MSSRRPKKRVKTELRALRSLALLAIGGYQRYVSPYKGFCCAYRSYTGHQSCSALGYRAIRKYGVWSGLTVLRKRFDRCATAFSRHRALAQARQSQSGYCDIGCPCDVPSCDLPSLDCAHGASGAVDCCSYAPCDCGSCGDWGRSKRQSDEEKYVYIPPRKWPDDRPRSDRSSAET